jgi:hypothetical protein
MAKGPKREVEWDGRVYKVRSDKISIPDLAAAEMAPSGSAERFAALTWLCAHTYPTGYSRPSPLAGFGGAIKVGP